MVDFSVLTRVELGELAKGRLPLPRDARRTKDATLEYMLCHADDQLREAMVAAVQAKAGTRKRPRAEAQHERRVAQRIQAELDQVRDSSRYLALPTDAERLACSRQFHVATSAAALRSVVCGVCAREVSVAQDGVQLCRLDSFTHRSRLTPREPHPQHDLFDGCLLEPAGVVIHNNIVSLHTCKCCRDELRRSAPHPPRLSLANNLWIGSVPSILSALTIPEQMLIAQLYPRVYVFKLYPKTPGYRPAAQTLQRGMRGTVSTYELDTSGVLGMVEGRLMPQLPDVLAKVISVTFVGVGPLPKQWLRTTFRVRRTMIFAALRFLKQHHRHYNDITISEERLAALPEDDVPDELLGVVRHCSDPGVTLQEGGGYVPDDADDVPGAPSDENAPPAVPQGLPAHGESAAHPDVIPLMVSGSVDTDLSRMTANDLMLWGLSNLWQSSGEGGYSVRHGQTPVSDFGRPRNAAAGPDAVAPPDETPPPPNYFERAFPCLFPYGRGGLEGSQPDPVDFREHARWALQYHDRRFRTHETFPFVVFGIQQRREALGSAKVQIRRKTFEQEIALLSTITTDNLKRAAAQETAKEPITDPAVLLLKRLVHGAAGRVQGTDAARYKVRGQIWSTCLVHGPPSMWITINPSDIHDPVAQLFAGCDINLDNFMATVGPTSDERAVNIANDPYAAARFFHFMVATILETLFQIRITPFAVKNGMGVLGKPTAYVGSVESQGRGSLHLHMLLWLADTPRSEDLHVMLGTDEFRQRILAYIAANIRAYLPGLETPQSVKAIPKQKDIAYSRPPHPDSADYRAAVADFELRLARAEQVHTCKVKRCLRYTKGGQLKCKRRAPFERAQDDYVKPDGRWGPKRLYRYMNGWIPDVLVHARCNNDGKLLTNGADTKNITFYVSSYAGKKQGRNHNMSAILADGYAYDQTHQRAAYVHDLREQQRLLMFRLLNSINREQELAAPMVVSYLMGWGDMKTSHSYAPLYWSSFMAALYKVYPRLRIPPRTRQANDGTGSNVTAQTPEDASMVDEVEQKDIAEAAAAEDGNENVTLDVSSAGNLYAKSQLTDYVLRGDALADFSVFRFIKDTYDATIRGNEGSDPVAAEEAARGPGRPRHQRARYIAPHPCATTKQRVLRASGHRCLVNVVGRWFARSDDPDVRDTYCASMLLLLKPWRHVGRDLKPPEQTWPEAFDVFMQTASEDIKDVVSGAQYFHECALAAEADRNDEDAADAASGRRGGEYDLLDADGDAEAEADGIRALVDTEEGLEALKASQMNYAERLHALHALAVARSAGYFAPSALASWDVANAHSIAGATGEDLVNLEGWRRQMAADVLQRQAAADGHAGEASAGGQPSVEAGLPGVAMDRDPSVRHVGLLEPQGSEDALPPVDLASLRADQFRAFDIISWHLDQTLAGNDVPPLRMVLYGEGGTGKSRVIQTVTQAFIARGCSFMLVKAAYTGIAASLIDGKTTHVIAHISVNKKAGMSDDTRRTLQAFWRGKRYLFLDEYSMLAKSFVAVLARNVAIGMEGSGLDRDQSFGGLNIILCGDLHQFPPVATAKEEALFYPNDIDRDIGEPDRMLGRKIYEEFTTVVILKEQMRVSDPTWRDFLVHLRYGKVTPEHLAMLRTLILSNADVAAGSGPSASGWPHMDASLVTARHGVRIEWNGCAGRKWCESSGQRLYIVRAQDRIKGKTLTMQERVALVGRGKTANRRGKKDLPEVLELAVGMKVMVTTNIQTDLDLANGARGEIVDIVLHPEEEDVGASPVVHLKYMPAYVLVKMYRTRASQLEGLPPGVIPVEPIKQSMQITLERDGAAPLKRSVTRSQFPMTPAYAFTDYRSQGQTIPTVLVDLKSPPPPAPLTLFNLYVALSRSSGRGSIRLLRDFEDKPFLDQHVPELLAEDARLEKLDRETKQWWLQMGRARS